MFAAALAFFLCAAMVFPMKRLALRAGLIDRPRADRHHRQPTPYLGGVAIMVAVVAAVVIATDHHSHVLVVVASALVVGLIGLVDDAVGFGPIPKLLVEIGVAISVVTLGTRLGIFWGPIDVVLTVAWLTILTNSFNLIDNMDGALACVGLAIAGLIVVGGLLTGERLLVVEGAILVGAFAGFLVHNFHPARIFMGDAGSLFIGFLLATLVLDLHFASRPQRGIALVLLMAPAIFDTTLVVISRVRAGRPIYLGATDHTAHRLMRLGLGTRSTAGLMTAATLIAGASGLAAGLGVLPALQVLAVFGAGGLALLATFLRLPAYEQDRTLAGLVSPRKRPSRTRRGS